MPALQREARYSQDLNRYSYVHNNPLSYTDMNGYGFFKKLGQFFKKFWKPLLAIAAAFALQFYIAPGLISGEVGFGAFQALNLPTQAAISGVSAGTASVISTGKPKAFLAGFGQGVLTFGVGSAFNCTACVGKAVAHGVVGGAFAEVHGGSFKSGFLSAGFTSAAGALDLGSSWTNLVKSAVIGGAGSELGGGKFADGAVTGAFVYVLNDLSHRWVVRQAVNAIDKVNAAIAAAGGFSEKAFTAAVNTLPKWMRTWYVELEASATLGTAGGGVSKAIWYDRKDRIWGAGETTLAGDSIGLDAGASVGFGFITGSASDMLGYFSTTSFSVAQPFEATLSLHRGMNGYDRGLWGLFGSRGYYSNVWGVGLNFGVGPNGAATSVTFTKGCVSPTFILTCN
jgi:hypothetical protein